MPCTIGQPRLNKVYQSLNRAIDCAARLSVWGCWEDEGDVGEETAAKW